MQQRQKLNLYFEDAIKNNWERLSLTDFNGVSNQYKDVGRRIAKLHILYEHIGIRPGDKIALCGRNSASWAIAFFSALTYGAVIVPILHDFKPDMVHHLVNHSEAKLMFVDEAMWENLDPEVMKNIEGALNIADFSMLFSRSEALDDARARLNELFGHRYPNRFTSADIRYYEGEKDEVCLINYTSGSTGFSKGVMLTYGNIWSNLQYCLDNLPFIKPGDGIVCMLPMAHMYGLLVEVVYGFVKGAHIQFLTRTPSPRVIMEAFAKVRPKMIVAVPLIIEKIIKTRVFPLLEKPLMKLMLRVPYVDDRLFNRIKQRLNETFGGRLEELILGGAGLNTEVEKFLNKIGFPFTVGYGMTECAPLISYSQWDETRLGSCGRVVGRMELRVDSPDPESIPGVLWVKGANVMKGYYKNPEATASCLTDDGWLNTGDICTVDDDGFIYLRGRDKNMILGASGQNIYPEEIEYRINNLPYVAESLVIDDDGKLTALVYPDIENSSAQGISERELETLITDNVMGLNKELPAYSQIKRVKLRNEEFEKTPKRSIKRYLYQNS